MAVDLSLSCEVQVYADASAAIGTCRRAGIGRIRHLAVDQLWLQERLRSQEVRLFKVAGQCNLSDLLTKHVPRNLLDRHLAQLPVRFAEVRAQSAPLIVTSGVLAESACVVTEANSTHARDFKG